MKRLLREPLVHFLILGAALVAASAVMPDRDVRRDDQIVISLGQIEHLAARFTRTWQRPPTFEELEGVIGEYAREEVAYREGMAIGLDQDDAIIRRRIRQKLDFIATDLSSLVEPTDEDLTAYMADHPDDFQIPPRFTFYHVFLDPNKRGTGVETDALRLLESLSGQPVRDAGELGDRTLIPVYQEDLSSKEIASIFGPDFAGSLATLTPEEDQGRWSGPFASGFGLHVVGVDSISEAVLPELDDVRNIVRREWGHSRRNEAKEQFYNSLLDRYTITVEWPTPVEKESGQ